MLAQLLRRKALADATSESEEPEHRLKRTLTAVDLTALGIGAIIGAGIFSSTGTAAAGGGGHIGAGPALIVSYVLAAVACGFAALCYAEMASMIPIAGSAYTYAYATLGEFVAWIIGWDLILEYAVGNVAVAVSWSGYFKCVRRDGFGLHTPRLAHLHDRPGAGQPRDLRAARRMSSASPSCSTCRPCAIVAALTVLLVVGVKESARVNAVIVAIKLILVVAFIAVGAFWSSRPTGTPSPPTASRASSPARRSSSSPTSASTPSRRRPRRPRTRNAICRSA